MNPQTGQTKFLLAYTVLFAFLICGIAGGLSPMASSATETHHQHPTFPVSSSDDTSDENCCLDQLKSSEEKPKPLPITISYLVGFGSVSGHFQFPASKFFPQEGMVIPLTSAPLFLLFSVFLN